MNNLFERKLMNDELERAYETGDDPTIEVTLALRELFNEGTVGVLVDNEEENPNRRVKFYIATEEATVH
jgi:hypothetical protein